MPLEDVEYIDDFVITNPVRATDYARFSADHLQNIKKGVQQSFPFISGPVQANHTELSYVDGVRSAIQPQIDSKLASTAYTADDVFAKVLTKDGPGSGLNADLLDGNNSSFFAKASDVSSLVLGKLLGYGYAWGSAEVAHSAGNWTTIDTITYTKKSPTSQLFAIGNCSIKGNPVVGGDNAYLGLQLNTLNVATIAKQGISDDTRAGVYGNLTGFVIFSGSIGAATHTISLKANADSNYIAGTAQMFLLEMEV